MKKTNTILRQKLDQITDQNIGNNISKQIDLIKNIGIAHSIILKQEAIVGKPETFKFNCFSYALDIINHPVVEKMMKDHTSIFIGSEFMEYLIQNKLQKIDFSNKREGDIIIYFSNNKPEHAGKIFSNRIISKWGTGHMWEHEVLEIPLKYGDTYLTFKAISEKEALNCFLDYTRTKGAKSKISS